MIAAVIGAALLPRRRRSGVLLLTTGLTSLWLFATPIVADGLLRLVERYPALDPSKPTNAGAIVILGGLGQRPFAPEFGGPMIEDELLERLIYGAFLARRSALPVLVSGTPEETHAMQASLARDFGVRTAWIESRSRDTYENAQLSARILGPLGIHRIILVTGSAHLWRAAREFTDAGLDVVPAPANVWVPREWGVYRFIPGARALTRSRTAVYELAGESVRRALAALDLRRYFYSLPPTTTSLIRITGEMSV